MRSCVAYAESTTVAYACARTAELCVAVVTWWRSGCVYVDAAEVIRWQEYPCMRALIFLLLLPFGGVRRPAGDASQDGRPHAVLHGHEEAWAGGKRHGVCRDGRTDRGGECCHGSFLFSVIF